MSGVLYSNKGNVKIYKEKFGYIGATPLIFTGSIRDNLTYGNAREISDNKMFELMKKFDLFKEEKRYDLNEMNTSLSSGQMQKNLIYKSSSF